MSKKKTKQTKTEGNNHQENPKLTGDPNPKGDPNPVRAPGLTGKTNKAAASADRIETVLVTGAGGSVGSLLISQLADKGYKVIATDLKKPENSGNSEKITWHEADLTDPAAISALVKGVDVVIHAAAWVDITVSFERQAPINLDAVIYLFEEALQRGVSRFIHFSTGSLYANSEGPLTEESPKHPSSAYEATKVLAEDYLFSQKKSGPAITILRPALIYGPRGKVLVAPAATVPALLSPLNKLVPQIHGGPRTNLVHSEDVARAAIHLLQTPQVKPIDVFNIACDDVITAGELMETILSTGGFETAPFSLPFPWTLIKAVLPLLSYEFPFRLINKATQNNWQKIIENENLTSELAPRVDREATPYMAGDVVFDNTKIKNTGFKFKFNSFLEGWKDTVSWYERNHWIPPRRGSSFHPSETEAMGSETMRNETIGNETMTNETMRSRESQKRKEAK